MGQQLQHKMLPQATHDELARQKFVNSLQAFTGRTLSPQVQQVYEQRVKPRFEQEHHRLPQTRHEVRQAMQSEPNYRWWGALRRTTQELMWNAVTTSVERQEPELVDRYQQTTAAPLGSLTLTPDFVVPAYQKAVDIHCMPGSYHSESGDDDITAGALYDRGVYLYVQGRLGPLNDGLGQVLVHNYLKREHPDFQPRTILDLGCSVGHSTLPYVDAYPDAEVYGLDVGAPMVRYAHARAEAMGKRAHFVQQNAEQMQFADASFDLIVSHIFLHEIPAFAVRNVFQECYRLLAPGGLMVHLEAPLYQGMDPFRAFLFDWETANNNEPFWSEVRDLDLSAIATAAGFPAESVESTFIPATVQPPPTDSQKAEGRGFGSRGTWLVVAARKPGV